jgi:hypothetical protein
MSKRSDERFRDIIYDQMGELGINSNHYRHDGFSKKSFQKALMIIAIRMIKDKNFLLDFEGEFVEPDLVKYLQSKIK